MNTSSRQVLITHDRQNVDWVSWAVNPLISRGRAQYLHLDPEPSRNEDRVADGPVEVNSGEDAVCDVLTVTVGYSYSASVFRSHLIYFISASCFFKLLLHDIY